MRNTSSVIIAVVAMLAWVGPRSVDAAPASPSPAEADAASPAPAGADAASPAPAGADSASTTPRAAAPKVAVTTVATLSIEPTARPGFVKSFAGGLAAGGLRVMDLEAVRAALQPHEGLAGCETAVCLKQVGSLLRVPLCGKATIEKVGSAAFRIDVLLTEARSATPLVHLERRCDLCNLREAREALSRAAADAAQQAVTKLRGQASRGPRPRHRTGAGRPGDVAHSAAPRRRAGHGRGGPPRIVQQDRGRALRLWGYAALGLGLAALIPGAALVAIHGKDTGEGPPASDRYRWNTRAGGATLLAVGGAALAAGATLVVVGLLRRSPRTPVVTVSPDPRGRGALVSGFFRF